MVACSLPTRTSPLAALPDCRTSCAAIAPAAIRYVRDFTGTAARTPVDGRGTGPDRHPLTVPDLQCSARAAAAFTWLPVSSKTRQDRNEPVQARRLTLPSPWTSLGLTGARTDGYTSRSPASSRP